MRSARRQVLVIARGAATETWRSPAHVVLSLCLPAFSAVLPQFACFGLQETRKLVCDGLLALTLTGGALAGTLAALGVVGGEVRRGSFALLRTKPVSREALLVGKVAGVCLAVLPLALTLGLAVLWGSRVAVDPYHLEPLGQRAYGLALSAAVGLAALARRRWGWACALAWTLPATSLLGLLVLSRWGWGGAPGSGWGLVDLSLLPALALALAGVLLATLVAAAVSLLLDGSAALLLCAALFAVGLVSDGWGPLGWWLPNWQGCWAPGGATGALVARAWAAAVLYGAGLLWLASEQLARKDQG